MIWREFLEEKLAEHDDSLANISATQEAAMKHILDEEVAPAVAGMHLMFETDRPEIRVGYAVNGRKNLKDGKMEWRLARLGSQKREV